MSKVDDELTRRFRRAERPVGSEDPYEGVARRRRRRRTLQRLEAGALAVAVVTGTVAGFVALRAAFREDGARDVGDAPLPGNGLIVFERWDPDGERSHLFTMQPDATEVRQLTNFGTSDHDPAVSPDGRTVAFVHEFEDRAPTLATISIGGDSAPRWLTDERLFVTSGPSWSPDGSRLTFAAHDDVGQRLFVMDESGGEARALTPRDLYWVEGAAWSPDGTRIAFSASRVSGDVQPSRWDLYTIRPDGSDLVRITSTPTPDADESRASWSPDGEQLVFPRSDTKGGSWLVIRTISNGEERRLTDGPVDLRPAWSPDGTVIAFARAAIKPRTADLWVIRPDGSGLEQLTTEGGGSASWQPIPAGSAESVSPSPEPSVSPNPEPEGVDVGLTFRLCESVRLGGIDFLGRGTDGYAWVGVPTKEDGTCQKFHGAGAYVVAADADGDRVAETFSELPWKCYVDCFAYDATDLDADGDEELIIASAFSIQDYYVMRYLGPPEEPSPVIVPVLVAEPGHPPADLHAGRPLRIDAGGDAGNSGKIWCEGYPESPVIVWAWASGPVDSHRPKEIHVTRLELQRDGLVHVLETNDYSIPADESWGYEEMTAPACGVDWDLLPP